jgi:hypothetical protein
MTSYLQISLFLTSSRPSSIVIRERAGSIAVTAGHQLDLLIGVAAFGVDAGVFARRPVSEIALVRG